MASRGVGQRSSIFYIPPMSLSDYTLLMRKTGGSVKDSLVDFHMATGDVAWPAEVQVKDPGVLDCPGESGERTFFPDVASFEAYDLKVEFKCRAEDCRLYELFKAFRNYLTGIDGTGTRLTLYSPYCGVGRQDVWVKSISDVEFRRDNIGEYASLEATFRVADPVTDIILTTDVSPLAMESLIGQPGIQGGNES